MTERTARKVVLSGVVVAIPGYFIADAYLPPELRWRLLGAIVVVVSVLGSALLHGLVDNRNRR